MRFELYWACLNRFCYWCITKTKYISILICSNEFLSKKLFLNKMNKIRKLFYSIKRWMDFYRRIAESHPTSVDSKENAMFLCMFLSNQLYAIVFQWIRCDVCQYSQSPPTTNTLIHHHNTDTGNVILHRLFFFIAYRSYDRVSTICHTILHSRFQFDVKFWYFCIQYRRLYQIRAYINFRIVSFFLLNIHFFACLLFVECVK